MAKDDRDTQRFGSKPRKTTVYRNGKLVKDEPKAQATSPAKAAPKVSKPKTSTPKKQTRPKANPMNTAPKVDSTAPAMGTNSIGGGILKVVRPVRKKTNRYTPR